MKCEKGGETPPRPPPRRRLLKQPALRVQETLGRQLHFGDGRQRCREAPTSQAPEHEASPPPFPDPLTLRPCQDLLYLCLAGSPLETPHPALPPPHSIGCAPALGASQHSTQMTSTPLLSLVNHVTGKFKCQSWEWEMVGSGWWKGCPAIFNKIGVPHVPLCQQVLINKYVYETKQPHG